MNSLYCTLLELYYRRLGLAAGAADPGLFYEDYRGHSEYACGLKRDILTSYHPRPEVVRTYARCNHLFIGVGKCSYDPSRLES